MRQKRILLTGGSGVLGQALLEKLTDSTVVCLTGQRPLENNNITVVPGDIRKPLLGLSQQRYVQLTQQIDWIIHSAAITDFTRPLEELRQCNVEGTRQMLAFAAKANAPLVHVSTAFVYPRDGHQFNHYERSKREAEAVVRQSDLPVTIVRPSIVMGDSQTGNTCRQQGIHRMIRLLLKGILPAVPGSVASILDIVPQDSVAEAIVRLVRHNIVGGDYWLTAGDHALPLEAGLKMVSEEASRLRKKHVAMPKLITPAAFNRLIHNTILPLLPVSEQQMVEASMGLFTYMNMVETFPCSFAQLRHQIGIAAPPAPHVTFQRSLAYIVAYNRVRQVQGA